MKYRSGDTGAALRFTLAVFLCFVGGYLMGLLHPLIPEDKAIVPITFVALLASPITVAITSIIKVGEAIKGAGLSKSERRRIDPALKGRRKILQIMVFVYMTLSVLTGVFLFFSTLPAGEAYALWIYRAIGAAVAFSVITSSFMLTDLGKLNDFEALLVRRNEERKKKAAILKKMKGSDSQ